MKLSSTIISTAVLLSSFVAAQPNNLHKKGLRHNHRRHAHHEKRAEVVVTVTMTTRVWDDGSPWSPETAKDDPKPTPEVKAKMAAEELDTPSKPKSTPAATTTKEKEAAPTKSVSGGKGLDAKFPDGEIDCGEFPSDYGALKLSWLETTENGWAGVQVRRSDDKYVEERKCTGEDRLCSYACPPGYTSAQWPEMQPASGVSLGGLLCKGGKLHLTRPSFPHLCQKGHGGVSVINKLDKVVAICRTNYPGNEDMNIPIEVLPGQEVELTNPDASNSYTWRGKKTSAQYYVNPAGVSVKDGCKWNSEGSGRGNWAPMIFGAGYSENISWLSIAQNQLNSGKLNFNVKIVAVDGGNLNGNCKYEDGVFSGAGNAKDGCTAALKSGKAAYVLY